MLKQLFIILGIIFGQALSAQKFSGFYLEPTVGTKIYTTKKSNLTVPLVTDYFTIKSKQFIGPVGIDIGLNLGYTFKNNDRLQFGVSQDGASQGYDIVGTSASSFTPALFIDNVISRGYGGVAYSNFSLVYKRCVLNLKSGWAHEDRFLKVHLNVGLSYVYKPDNGIENLTGPSGISYTAPDSSRVTIEVNQYNVPILFKRSFKFNLGVDFTFGKKDREWFNVNISFISNRSGHSFFSYTKMNITVDNKKGTTYYGYFNYNGTGNGLYFTLSKRIYPIKMYQRRLDKRIEKYNQLKG
jgi:hypothetical protein